MNGLEEELGGRVEFIKVNLWTKTGDQIGKTYEVVFAGTHILLDGSGQEIYRVRGTPDVSKIIELATRASAAD